LEQSGYSFS
jgi:hypothetical protein